MSQLHLNVLDQKKTEEHKNRSASLVCITVSLSFLYLYMLLQTRNQTFLLSILLSLILLSRLFQNINNIRTCISPFLCITNDRTHKRMRMRLLFYPIHNKNTPTPMKFRSIRTIAPGVSCIAACFLSPLHVLAARS